MTRKILTLLFAALIVLTANPIATAQFMFHFPGKLFLVSASEFIFVAASRITSASTGSVYSFIDSYSSGLNFGASSKAICFAANHDSATDHDINSMTIGDDAAPCTKIAEVDSGLVNIAAFMCPNHVQDSTIDVITTASEGIATNGSANCMSVSHVAVEGHVPVASAAIDSTSTTLNMAFTNIPAYSIPICYATSYRGNPDRTFTWTSGGVLTLTAEDFDEDVENNTRSHSAARFFLSTTVANQVSSFTITATLSGAPVAAAGLCIAPRIF